MSGVIVARVVDASGNECARAAVDPSQSIWYFALLRDAAPCFVEVCDGSDNLGPKWKSAVRLQPCLMKSADIIAVHVRVVVPPELERVVLWLVAFTTWHMGRFR